MSSPVPHNPGQAKQTFHTVTFHFWPNSRLGQDLHSHTVSMGSRTVGATCFKPFLSLQQPSPSLTQPSGDQSWTGEHGNYNAESSGTETLESNSPNCMPLSKLLTGLSQARLKPKLRTAITWDRLCGSEVVFFFFKEIFQVSHSP